MARRSPNRNRPPLDEAALRALAIAYLGRFATSRMRLRDHLARKLRERGWAEATPPDLDALVARMAALGYVDDRAYAAAKAGSLARRGYGARRQADALRAAGIGEEDRAAIADEQAGGAFDAALRFAARRRIGPYADAPADPDRRRREAAAMLRAGHDAALVRRIVAAAPGAIPEQD